MPERRSAANAVARGRPGLLRVGPAHIVRHKEFGQSLGISAVGAGGQGEERAAVGLEDQRLDDLPDVAADRPGGVRGGPGLLRKPADADSDSRLTGRRLESFNASGHGPAPGRTPPAPASVLRPPRPRAVPGSVRRGRSPPLARTAPPGSPRERLPARSPPRRTEPQPERASRPRPGGSLRAPFRAT